MTDPTTRDPAASLARCIELGKRVTFGAWETGGESDPMRVLSAHNYWCVAEVNEALPEALDNVAFITGAAAFIRDAAPALLAEVARLNAEVAILENNLAAQEACTANVSAAFDERNEACAASERALAGAVALLERASPEVLDLANLLHSDYGRIKQADSDRAEALAREIDTFLAHHGARTGESK